MGGTGRRVSNSHGNEYEDGREVADAYGEADGADELSAHLPELSEEELNKLAARMEEGFYPDERVKKMEQDVKKRKKGKGSREEKRKGQTTEEEQTAEQTERAASGVPHDELRDEDARRERAGRSLPFSAEKQERPAQTPLRHMRKERERQTSGMENEESGRQTKSLAFREKVQREKNSREAGSRGGGACILCRDGQGGCICNRRRFPECRSQICAVRHKERDGDRAGERDGGKSGDRASG